MSQVTTLLDDFHSAWNTHDAQKLLSILTEDCVYEDVTMGAVNRGKTEVKAFFETIFNAFPDFTIDVASGFMTADNAGMEWTMSGTHTGDLPGLPATGKRFSVRGASICELRDGKIRRNSDYWDMVTFLKQIGVMS